MATKRIDEIEETRERDAQYKYLEAMARAKRDKAQAGNAAAYEAATAGIDAGIESAQVQHQNRVEALGAERDAANRNTSVMMDKLAKYLPQLQRANGTAGSGLADTQAAAMYNSALNRQSQANAVYRQGVRDSEDRFAAYKAAAEQQRADARERQLTADTAADSAMNDAIERYTAAEMERHNVKNEKELENVMAAADSIWSRKIGEDALVSEKEFGEWEASVRSMMDALTPEQQRQVERAIETQRQYIRSTKEQEQHEETAGIDSDDKGPTGNYVSGNHKFLWWETDLGKYDDFTASYDGKNYHVVSQGEAKDVPGNLLTKYDEGEMFLYNNKIYIINHSKIFEVGRDNIKGEEYDALFRRMLADRKK